MNVKKYKNKLGKLKVSENKRYLKYEDGTPFFYLGDTAWELFHRLNREEAKHYLSNRAEKGFTVIQAVALAELNGLDIPNPYGEIPLIDLDPTKPNENYFKHVDHIIEYTEELGLYMGLLPTWGKYWKLDGRDSVIFTPENARIYGRFLGNRYKDKAVIWILGGDQNIENEEEFKIVEAMALGLKDGDNGNHLITFHPRGPGSSSEFIQNVDWLDLNMCQTSHGAHDHDTGIFIEQDYNKNTEKPVLDGEPRYETMPVGFYYQEVSRYDRFDDYDVRQAAYWALMAGSCGHTYGNNSIWQMWKPEHKPVIWANIPWYEALDTPGAFQMGHMRKFFESYPFTEMEATQDFILDGPSHGGGKIRAMLSKDKTIGFVYSPRGKQFTMDRRIFKPLRLKEYWFDPRYGCKYYAHTTANASFQTYVPPTSGRGNDWILILEDEKSKKMYTGL
ncbi:MAG: glycoside hydrolase family 140 protein [Clostridiales bacterium]